MTADEALEFVESLLAQQNIRLSDLERIVFKGAWNGDTYKEIHRSCENRTSPEHLERNVSAQLRQKLSQVLGEPVKKRNLQGSIDRARKALHSNQSLNSESLNSESLNSESLNTESLNSQSLNPESLNSESWSGTTLENPVENRRESEIDREDWYRFVPDVPLFEGRKAELDQLALQIRLRGCRLLAICGVGGGGKTALAVRLGQAVWDQFEVCIWRSIVHQRPTPDALIADLQEVLSDRPANRLRDQLRDRRCLIVLDGFEAVLKSGVHDGAYLDGYEEYSQLLNEISTTMHQSCIILTSREEPKEVTALKEQMPASVQSFFMRGLGERSVRALFNHKEFNHKDNFSGSDGDWWTLRRQYGGNPFALNEVAAFIRDFYRGDIARYLEESQEEVLLENARSQIETQIARLSPLERQVVDYLAEHQPATLKEIQTVNPRQVRSALNSLRRRSLLDIEDVNYSLTQLLRCYFRDGSEAD
ncbi:MAG: hypothetical protein HC895_26005 [Leptolyngbyaceae cyanobacterium SM1_3_5]|nr:hypothetical protein [Leptolyngbyaceae cyanobacterium SM1_3_5]